jgi:transposase
MQTRLTRSYDKELKESKSNVKELDKWIGWAEETGLEELIRFSKGLNRARKGLLSYCKHKITSAKIESFNATIKRIIRMACGYRDIDYLYHRFSW